MSSNEILELVGLLNSDLLWIGIIAIVVVFYTILSLLTWSFKRPLMFLGVPTIIVGVLLVILRFSISLFPIDGNILKIVSAAINPLLTIGVICTLIGIAMTVVYKLLNKKEKLEQIKQMPEVKE